MEPWFWNGPPKVTGTIKGLDLKSLLVPIINGNDFAVQIEGCDDNFFPVFTSESMLNDYMTHLADKLGIWPSVWEIKRVDDVDAIIAVTKDLKLRLMINPIAVTDHHTKWNEIENGELIDKEWH